MIVSMTFGGVLVAAGAVVMGGIMIVSMSAGGMLVSAVAMLTLAVLSSSAD